MKVLITAASRHGATEEISQWIATVLSERGFCCTTSAPADVKDISEYDAVIIGSAVYVGQWLGAARDFVERFSTELQAVPVWMFSSGLADVPSKDANGTPSLKARMDAVSANGHRHFPGKLDVLQLSLAERAAIMAARGKYGDSRDREAVNHWAQVIADELALTTV